jgi:sec-independent protein translocase protein TatB
MLGFSFTEIILLAVIALVVIGPKQLPEVARSLGRFLNELKRTSNSFTREFRENMDRAKVDPIRYDEPPKKAPPETTAEADQNPLHNPLHTSDYEDPHHSSQEVSPPQFPLDHPHDHYTAEVTPATVAKKETDSHD